MRTKGRMIRALVLAGQLLVLILSVGLLARPAGRMTESHATATPSCDPTDANETPRLSAQARRPMKRRLTLVVGSIGTIVAMLLTAAGVTLASFSTTTDPSQSTFTAGTVTLSNSTLASCPVSDLLPNATPASCTFTTTYSGSSAAYLAVDVLIETQAGSGGTKLYNPTDSSNDLQVTVSSTSPTVTYEIPTNTTYTTTTCPISAPVGSSCYELDDELISTAAFTSSSPAINFDVAFKLLTSSTTGYQGGTAQVILTTHATQAANNLVNCSTTSPSVSATDGYPCAAAGSFSWS